MAHSRVLDFVKPSMGGEGLVPNPPKRKVQAEDTRWEPDGDRAVDCPSAYVKPGRRYRLCLTALRLLRGGIAAATHIANKAPSYWPDQGDGLFRSARAGANPIRILG